MSMKDRIDRKVAMEMAPKIEAYVRDLVANEDHGLESLLIRELDDLAGKLADRQTPYIARMADAVAAERAGRLEAARNEPVFKRGDLVKVISRPLAHPLVMSAPPLPGMLGRVVGPARDLGDQTLGMYSIRFPAGALGYKGSSDIDDVDLDDRSTGIDLYVPNKHLEIVDA